MNIHKVLPPDLGLLYRELDASAPAPAGTQPPRIGLSANLKEGLSCVATPYIDAVLRAGGAPVIIPVTASAEALASLLETIDGLLLTGGGDINPLYAGEEPLPQLGEGNSLRDQYDFTLLRLAADRQIPVFGICRGQQVINLAYGGTLYQDIYAQREATTCKHSQEAPRSEGSHTVSVRPGTSLYTLLGERAIVNSFHHQAVKEAAPGFRVTAVSADGLIEAMESAVPYRDIFSVQWHPEAMAAAGDPAMLRLFGKLVAQARLYNRAKRVHAQCITLDSHCDTPMLFAEGASLHRKTAAGRVNLPKMFEGKWDAACVVAYIRQEARDDASLQQATEKAAALLGEIKRQAEACSETAAIAYTPHDVARIKKAGKKALLLGIENGYAIGKELANLARFKETGIVYMTLCHNGDNDLCDSAKGDAEWNGLSPLGREAVREMNRLGIVVDVSHASEKTFYDVLETSCVPIVASHSSARALCNHPRNLDDDQLRAIAARGGVVQVCLYNGFLREDEQAAIPDIVAHIRHIAGITGVAHVGLGSDFDGGGGIPGCDGSNELINVTKALLEAGFTEDELEKIVGGNFLRVIETAQAASLKQTI
ncbi:MAG: gamma-glutamyl-gamma-aminobutyrate hydrolase family protein [Parabacteroides sp.]|nr:gamma-glutamyl-gamma-aminobutyrate hydrolase family protein [Parabacteroides sp.]